MREPETPRSQLTLTAWAGSLLGLLLGAAAPGVLSVHAQAEPCTTVNLLAGKLPSRMERVRRDAALVTDGVAVPDGQGWNSELAVMMDSTASELTYDLGQLQPLSAVYLQADANDTYTLSVSSDGAEGTFVPVAELPNVVASGHGLRGRVARFDAVSARFVRLGDPRGDDAYSVSELQLFCQPPTPFPPVLEVLSPALARAPSPDAVYDLLATYEWQRNAGLGRAGRGEPRLQSEARVHLRPISGLSLNQQAADAIYAHMVAGRTVPDGLFAGPDDMLAELRARILSGR